MSSKDGSWIKFTLFRRVCVLNKWLSQSRVLTQEKQRELLKNLVAEIKLLPLKVKLFQSVSLFGGNMAKQITEMATQD